MPNDMFLKVRLDAVSMLEIERQAKVLAMPKSKFARLLLTGGALPNPQNPLPASAAPSPSFDESALLALDSRLSKIEESQAVAAGSFDSLLQFLREFHRSPSFREFRARGSAEGIEKRQSETDLQFLTRLANSYFLQFSVWPDPADSRKFGPLPSGVTAADFPKKPTA